MTYADRDDIELQFGASNVLKWADIDNDADNASITDRIDWALDLADEEINTRLRMGPYAIPFTTVPVKIKNMAAIWAGILLYEARGVPDSEDGAGKHQLSQFKKQFDLDIRKIHAYLIRFDVTLASATYPQLIEPDDE